MIRYLRALWCGFYRRPVLLFLALMFLLLWLTACALPVRPVARIVPDADGGAHFEADPDREPQVGGALHALALILPSPYRELLSALVSALVAGRAARRGPERALEQTVAGIEKAKEVLAGPAVETLHDCLAKQQDESTKRRVWEIRP